MHFGSIEVSSLRYYAQHLIYLRRLNSIYNKKMIEKKNTRETIKNIYIKIIYCYD